MVTAAALLAYILITFGLVVGINGNVPGAVAFVVAGCLVAASTRLRKG